MAVFKANYTADQAGTTIVAAVADRIILVTRIVFANDGGGTFKLVSDPTGTPVDVTQLMYVGADQTLDLKLGHTFGLSAGKGKALGLNSQMGLPAGHSIMVWYEVVT